MSFITPRNEAESVEQPVTVPAAQAAEEVKAAPGERELWPEPIEGGSGAQIIALLRYLTQTDVHTYAFSVAANVILSLFPFIVLLLTISRVVFHSPAMAAVVSELMYSYLPVGQDFVMRNMALLVHPHKGVQIFSVVMLLISSTGVFLPLEVALNNVWRAPTNRSYLHNQIVSLGLAFAVGLLAMLSVAVSTAQKSVLGFLFFGHTENTAYYLMSKGFLSVMATACSVTLFFLVYWILPNRKIPALAVLPTAIVTGLLWEGAKHLYILVLPHLDFQNVYGPFQTSVGLMIWAFLSGLMLLAGAHFSATRHGMRMAAAHPAEGL
jgi:YihY family inner membrane protein